MTQLLDCWVQRSDLSSVEHSRLSKAEALELFYSIDWHIENRLEKELEKSEKDNCPAGFGVLMGDDRILHLCPSGFEISLCFFHLPKKRKFLWIAYDSEDVHEYFKIPNRLINQLFELAFQRNAESILLELAPYANR